jgi:hypothetical protein
MARFSSVGCSVSRYGHIRPAFDRIKFNDCISEYFFWKPLTMSANHQEGLGITVDRVKDER